MVGPEATEVTVAAVGEEKTLALSHTHTALISTPLGPTRLVYLPQAVHRGFITTQVGVTPLSHPKSPSKPCLRHIQCFPGTGRSFSFFFQTLYRDPLTKTAHFTLCGKETDV